MPIVLNSPTQSITVVLAGAKTTLDANFLIAYEDLEESAGPGGAIWIPGNTQGATNGTAAVTAVTGPGAGYIRRVTEIDLNNSDTGSITASWTFVDSVGSVSRVFWKITRATLEQSIYTVNGGWQQYSVAGAKQ